MFLLLIFECSFLFVKQTGICLVDWVSCDFQAALAMQKMAGHNIYTCIHSRELTNISHQTVKGWKRNILDSKSAKWERIS